MVQIVKPIEFAKAFDRVVRSRAKEISQLWSPWNAREYTSTFLNKEDCILGETADRLRLKYTGPWWTLDAIFFEEVDAIHFPEKWGMAKHISVAIEHENASGRAAYQANKLCVFDAPLKVLITYPGGPGRRDDQRSAALLDRCASIVHGADVFGDFSHSRQLLIVLGTDESSGASGAITKLTWSYHQYDHKKFAEIRP